MALNQVSLERLTNVKQPLTRLVKEKQDLK